MGEIGILI